MRRLTALIAACLASAALMCSPVTVSAAADVPQFRTVLDAQPEAADETADFTAAFSRAACDYGDTLGKSASAETGSTVMVILVTAVILLSLVWGCTAHRSYPVFSALLLLCGINALSIAELVCRLTGADSAAFAGIPLWCKLTLLCISLILAAFCFIWRRMSAFLMMFSSAFPLTLLTGWLLLRSRILQAYAAANGYRRSFSGIADAAQADRSLTFLIGTLAAFAIGLALAAAVLGTRYRKPALMIAAPLSFGLRGGYLLTALIFGTCRPFALTWLAAALFALGGFVCQLYMGHGMLEHAKQPDHPDPEEQFPDGEMPQETYIDADFYGVSGETAPEPPMKRPRRKPETLPPQPDIPANVPEPPVQVPQMPEPAENPAQDSTALPPDPFAAAAAQELASQRDSGKPADTMSDTL